MVRPPASARSRERERVDHPPAPARSREHERVVLRLPPPPGRAVPCRKTPRCTRPSASPIEPDYHGSGDPCHWADRARLINRPIPPPSLTGRPRPARSPPEHEHRSGNPSGRDETLAQKRRPRAGPLLKTGATKHENKIAAPRADETIGAEPADPGQPSFPPHHSPNFVPAHTRNARAQNYGARFCFLPFPPSGPPPGGGPRRMKLASGVPRQSRETNG